MTLPGITPLSTNMFPHCGVRLDRPDPNKWSHSYNVIDGIRAIKKTKSTAIHIKIPKPLKRSIHSFTHPFLRKPTVFQKLPSSKHNPNLHHRDRKGKQRMHTTVINTTDQAAILCHYSVLESDALSDALPT